MMQVEREARARPLAGSLLRTISSRVAGWHQVPCSASSLLPCGRAEEVQLQKVGRCMLLLAQATLTVLSAAA